MIIKLETLSLVLVAGGAVSLTTSAVIAQSPGGHVLSAAPGRVGPPMIATHTGGGGGGPTDGPGWSDNFDSYANGAQLMGLGGFEGWPGYAANNPTAFASSAFAASAPNSCRLALANPSATPATDLTDFVHQYAISGGHWVFRIKTYMPSAAVASGPQPAPYFMLLNSYPTPSWSVQVHFEKNLGRVLADRVGGAGGVGGGLSDPAIPLILDQWVELVVDFNLDTAPSGTYSVTYGGTPVITGGVWKVGSAPPFAFKALNLYDAGTDAFYFDDASLAPAGTPATCYANCDSSTVAPCLNVLDFACFLNMFASGASYANCDNSTTPPVLNVLDFACFINTFAAGCSNC